ncbi:MAG TPA: CHAT domain-containing tetratricopeptide repeat protein [Thermoanaerobaculia bacterium]|nr:CHAT domain-containing tetratricopeptide repeat protein [Thermoanaerobaculia bacterium]
MKLPAAALAAVLLVAPAVPRPAPAAAEPPAGGLQAEVLSRLDEGEAARAAALLPRLLDLLRRDQAGDPPALAATLEELGEHFAGACDGATAADLLGQALALREGAQGADHLDVAANLNLLATVRFFLGEWSLGEAAEQRALAIRLQHEAPRPAAESYRDLGILYYSEGRFREAQDALESALERFERERPPDRAALAETRSSLAEVHRARGDLRAAEPGFARAADEARSEAETAPEVYAWVLNHRAGLKRDRGRYAEAKSDLRQALAILSPLDGSERDVATLTLNLADLSRLQKDHERADAGFRQALELAERALCPGHPDLLFYLNQYALSLAEQGRHREAEPLYRRALKVAEAALGPDHPTVAQGLHDLAVTRAALGDYAEADALSARALAIRSAVFGSEHPEVAATQVERARFSLQRTGSASAAAMAQVEEAIRVLEGARVYPELAIEAYVLQAELRQRRRDAAGAQQALARALDLIDGQRLRAGGADRVRAAFLRSYARHHLRLADWQLQAGEVAAALATTERYRARLLQDQLAAFGIDLLERARGRPAALERRRLEARSRIAALHAQLAFTRSRGDLGADRRARILGLEKELAAAYEEYEAAVDDLQDESAGRRRLEGRTIGAAEMQGLVPPGGLLLLYQIGEERSHLFLVPTPPAAPRAQALEVTADAAALLGVSAGPLTAAVLRRLLEPAAGDQPAAAPDPARRLHGLWRALVPRDLWSQIAAAQEVVLVPDRSLHRLPFEQLVVDPGAGGGAVRYWLDDGPPIRYAASASTLAALLDRVSPAEDAATPPVLTVADPIYDPADLPGAAGSGADLAPAAAEEEARGEHERPPARLPRTADESDAIRAVFAEIYGDAGADVVALAREQATEARVRAALGGKRFVHLGTHGFVDEKQSELFAGLALSPPPSRPWPAEDDGLLQLHEIYDLELGAELAVLSACRTHAGAIVEGEGVFALSRGFLAAGSRRVVASLWQVEERSTAVLMDSFFRAVLSDYRAGRPIRYSAALRDAKREVRRRPQWSRPFFWAPFVLTGVE